MATSEVQKTVLQFVDKLDSLEKFDVEEFNLPEIFSKAHNIHELIYSKSLSYYFQKELKDKSLVSDVFYSLTEKTKNVSI